MRIVSPEAWIFIDAFCDAAPADIGPTPPGVDVCILVTHDHWDHFCPRRTAAAAQDGATVIAPSPVIRRLRGKAPETTLVALDPDGAEGASACRVAGSVRVTAFRTRHGRFHNSYLVETARYRLFHDGDSEDTRPLDVRHLAPVDVLFLCPWQGSDWVRFVTRLAPRVWHLVHLSEEERAAHHAGRFLPELCDAVPCPDRIVCPAPGATYRYPADEPGAPAGEPHAKGRG